MKKKKNKDLLKRVRGGLRLKTKAPRCETPKTVYSRKRKHQGPPEGLFSWRPGARVSARVAAYPEL